MTLWLPEDEAAQLRFEFETELARLETARAEALGKRKTEIGGGKSLENN
jgi:hypothetical protein